MLLPGVAYATELVTAQPEPTTYWLSPPALQISAYQRTGDGSDVQLVEVYNDSDTLLALEDWRIVGTFRSGNETYQAVMKIERRSKGMLEPGAHALVDAGRGISNASFAMQEWVGRKPNGALVSLSVAPLKSRVATQEYVLKSTGTVYSELWRRTSLSSGGYSTALTSFAIGGQAQLYDHGLYEAPGAPALKIVEIYPYSSDCAPNDKSILCGDYVKLYNPTDTVVDASQYVLRSDSSSQNRTASNTIHLEGTTIAPHGYSTISVNDSRDKLSLTNSGGYVWLEDIWGLTTYEHTMARYESAGITKQGYSYAQNVDGAWDWTSNPSPFGANVFPVRDVPVPAPVLECPVGKYRNPETNRCRAIEDAVNELATCPEGQARNPATNRCRMIVVVATASLAPCGEGQERNPSTNRCRSIASAVAELLPCDEGYERNPATNRCRKVPLASIPLAPFPVQPITQSPQSTALWWAVGTVVVAGAAYAVWEWRQEVTRLLRRLMPKRN